MTQGEKKKFRMSSVWKKFRQKKKKEANGIDWITKLPLAKTWNLHHLDMRDKYYKDLSDEAKFLPLNKDTHEFLHWLYYLWHKDAGILTRIECVLFSMLHYAKGTKAMEGFRQCMMPLTEVRHKKTGNIYERAVGTVIDCTNSRDGTECVLYMRDGKLFVREAKEFAEKFEDVVT